MELLRLALDGAQLKDQLINAAGAIGLFWYFWCLVDLGRRPTAADAVPTGFRQFQALSITTISVSLATYVGYVIGLPSAPTPAAREVAAAGAAAAAALPSAPALATPAIKVVVTSVSSLQVASAALYVLSLLVAVYFYRRTKDRTEPAITGLAKSLLGFVAGVFSISLAAPH